jgi:phage gp36-like protein
VAAYCNKADLVERFGAAELAQLTDETAAAAVDDSEVTKACDEATSLVDAYLSTRFIVPVADPVPTIVRKWACDIARKFLWKDRAREGSPVLANYDAAISQLKDAAKGMIGLPDAVGVQVVQSGAAITVIASEKVFTDELLSYMP